MIEWIVIVLLTLAGGTGWYFAMTKGITVNQTQIQNNTQTQIQETGQATIVEGGEIRNVEFRLTNVRDLGYFFAGLSPFQKRECEFSRDGGGWTVKFPVTEGVARTNTVTKGETNRTNY